MYNRVKTSKNNIKSNENKINRIKIAEKHVETMQTRLHAHEGMQTKVLYSSARGI